MSNSYLSVTPEQGASFFRNPPSGPIIMLNLLSFKEIADYSAAPELAPIKSISGKQAYDLYMKFTLPFIKEAGSELVFMGKAHSLLIGPMDEKWDLMLLVKHRSASEFLKFAQNPDYLSIAHHRTAALSDSRLLPLSSIDLIS